MPTASPVTSFLATARAFGFVTEGMDGRATCIMLPMSDTSEYTMMRQDAPQPPASYADPASLAYHADGELLTLYHGTAGALLAMLIRLAGEPMPSDLSRYDVPGLVDSVPTC